MKPLFQTVEPRYSNKINEVTGAYDFQVPGLIKTVNAVEQQAVDANGVAKGSAYYTGTAVITNENGIDETVSIIISAKSIAKVSQGDTKWLTQRINEELGVTGYSCGGLDVTQNVSADRGNALKAKYAHLMPKHEEIALE